MIHQSRAEFDKDGGDARLPLIQCLGTGQKQEEIHPKERQR